MSTDLFAFMKKEATVIDAVMREELSAIVCPHLPDILSHVLLAGGKRVRPLLTLLCARLVNPELASRSLYQLATVVEYLHVASLLHDDVVDRADQRRGKPTANTLWGNAAAILAGDFLHARAMTLASMVGGVDCLAIIGRATAAMVEAEFLQLDNAEQQDLVTENYYAVINGKTASLITAACEVGAFYAGALEPQLQAVRIYGHNLGLAFQIIDDLLDYGGDEVKTGKTVGNDFVEGKMTLPLILTLDSAPTEEKNRLLDLLGADPEERLLSFGEAQQIIARQDGFGRARQQAVSLMGEALAKLDNFSACEAKTVLSGLANYVLSREK
ncbi:MAG: polyprenyl synthetase family protein [Deltaproteobacteria bacterium]